MPGSQLPNNFNPPPVVRGDETGFWFRPLTATGAPASLSGATVAMHFFYNPQDTIAQAFASITGTTQAGAATGMYIDVENSLIGVTIGGDITLQFPLYTPTFYRIPISLPGQLTQTYLQGSWPIDGA